MNTVPVDGLHEVYKLLQEGKVEQAQAALLGLISQAEVDTTSGTSDTFNDFSGRIGRWLGLFLDTDHNLLLSRMGEADADEIRVLDRHIEARRELLELALQAGDLAEEMARTYELLGGATDEDGLAKGVMRELA